MKVYNKKGFASGAFLVVLGVLNLTAVITNNNGDVKDIILILFSFFGGLVQL